MTGSDFRGMADGLIFMLCALLLLAPLGVWKAIEIIIWIYRHVHVSIQ